MDSQYLVTVKRVDLAYEGGLTPAIKSQAFESMNGVNAFISQYEIACKAINGNYTTQCGKVIFIKKVFFAIELTKIKMMANSFRIGGGMDKSEGIGFNAHRVRYESLVDALENMYVFGENIAQLAIDTVKKIIPDFCY